MLLVILISAAAVFLALLAVLLRKKIGWYGSTAASAVLLIGAVCCFCVYGMLPGTEATCATGEEQSNNSGQAVTSEHSRGESEPADGMKSSATASTDSEAETDSGVSGTSISVAGALGESCLEDDSSSDSEENAVVHYTIDENAVIAPKPNPACYGETDDPAVITSLIEQASELLDGQDVIWDEDYTPIYGSKIRYYYDETILVIAWKELIDGKACAFAEVKIADASQLRRKLTEDSYGSGIRAYCSELADEANAVLAANADFYAFRPIGITVYQRELYRFEGEDLDTCFIDTSGNMRMVHAGVFETREQVESYIAENDILFSLAFGPILVEDGVVQDCTAYPIGEIGMTYSRAALGMTGDLHYLLMTINYDCVSTCATVSQLAEIIAGKGCINAYTLDGGQTAELYMNGSLFNRVDYDAERQVSDILYFATALPEDWEAEQ